MLAEHKPPVYSKGGLRLVTSSVRRFPPDCLDPKIHHANLIQSILAKIEANPAGADDAVMLDMRGFVAETNATHVFLVQRGPCWPRLARWPAPRASPGRRCWSFAARTGSPAGCDDLSLAEFYRADEVFCTGTMGELAGVVELDGRTIGDGQVGPITQRLSQLYAELTAATGEVIVAGPGPGPGREQ